MEYNRKNEGVESVGSVLQSLLRELGLEQRVKVGQFFSLWEEIVGEQIARHARPVEYMRGVIWVSVDSSAWLAELSQYMKPELLKKLRRRSGSITIKDVKFRIG